MTDTQQFYLEDEFRRAVKRCRSLGYERMQKALFDQFEREPLGVLISKSHAEWKASRATLKPWEASK